MVQFPRLTSGLHFTGEAICAWCDYFLTDDPAVRPAEYLDQEQEEDEGYRHRRGHGANRGGKDPPRGAVFRVDDEPYEERLAKSRRATARERLRAQKERERTLAAARAWRRNCRRRASESKKARRRSA